MSLSGIVSKMARHMSRAGVRFSYRSIVASHASSVGAPVVAIAPVAVIAPVVAIAPTSDVGSSLGVPDFSSVTTVTRATRIVAGLSRDRFMAWLGRLSLALIVLAYLLIGVLGRDPWKQDETYTFGIIAHMLHSGDWIVPTNAGQPFMEKPPLYAWVAVGFASVFGRWLGVVDAARLASVFFTAVTLVFVARSARLFHRTLRWSDAHVVGTISLFVSTFVVIKHVHDLMTDVALLAGASVALFGLMSLATVARSSRAALWLGLGVGVAMMAKGVFIPLVFGIAAVLAPLLVPACRTRRYGQALLIAFAIFVPFATIWPAALYGRSPELFKVWFWDNNIGRFFGFSVAMLGAENDKHEFVLRTLMSSALPIGPLALYGFMRGGWRRLRDGAVAVPSLVATVGLSTLAASATARQLYVLPLIPALALFASAAIAQIPARVHMAWDYVCRIVFGVAVTIVWAAWAVMTGPVEHHSWLNRLSRWLPLEYVVQTPLSVFVLACVLTAAWGVVTAYAARAGVWRGVVSWTAGVTALWALVFTLFVPWIDYSKSYRSAFSDLAEAIAPYWAQHDCMASYRLGESEAPMLELFAGIEHRPIGLADPTPCRWLIVQSEGRVITRPSGDWVPFWGGSRPGDDDQALRVYQRSIRNSAQQSAMP